MKDTEEKIEMKPEKIDEWDANCYLFARACWELGCRTTKEVGVNGFRGEVVNAVGLHGLYEIDKILDEYYDIWEESVNDD